MTIPVPASRVRQQEPRPKLSKRQVALYLLQHPSWYPDFWRRVRLNLAHVLLDPPIGRAARIAAEWAEERACSIRQALDSLGGADERCIVEDFPDAIAVATQLELQATAQKGWGSSADLIYSICETIEARNVVETGVAHGFSSLAILLSVTRRGGHLWSVDMPSPNLRDQTEVGIVVPAALRQAWTLERSPDSVGLPKVLAKAPPFDFCHYDSDKSYEGRQLSYPRLWASLRHGGVFMSDDIADNTAFRDFAAEIGEVPIVVKAPGSGASGDRYVGLIRKL